MKLKRLSALLLAALLLLGCLSGCKKAPSAQDGTPQTAQSTPGSPFTTLSEQSEDAADPTAPRFAYVPEYFDIPQEVVSAFLADCAEDLVFFGGRIDEGTLHYTRIFTDEDGNEREQEIEQPNFREALFACDLKTGKASELEQFRYPEPLEGWDEMDSRIIEIRAQPDRSAWIAVDAIPVRYNLPDGFDPARDQKESYATYGQNQLYLLHIGEDGTELGRIELGSTNFFHLLTDETGRVYISSNESISVFEPDGQLRFTLENPDSGTLCQISKDQMALNCLVYDPLQKASVPFVHLIDAEGKSLGEKIPLTQYCADILPGNGEYLFYYQYNNAIFGYLTDREERPCVLNWIDCDIEPSRVSRVRMLPDGSVFAFYSEYTKHQSHYQIIRLHVEDVSSQPAKTVLQMAGYQVNGDMSDKVVAFNRASKTCRIALTDYSGVSATPEAGLQVLITQIMAGQVPDLFLTAGLPVSQLAARGLLTDLYPLIDSGKYGLSRSSFVQSVLKALEIDGKLYQMPVAFEIMSAFGLERTVGGYGTWDFAAVQDAMAQLPEDDATIFNRDMTKSIALEDCIRINLSSFVDWTTGTCSFDSDAFLSLLNFANSFPAEYDAANDNEPYEPENQRIARGAQLLNACRLNSFSSYLYQCVFFEEPIRFIGYPSGGINNGSCFTMEDVSPFAISASCRDVDGAWEFISSFVTDEAQIVEDDNYNQFPINKAAFDDAAACLKQYRYSMGNDGKPYVNDKGETVRIPWEVASGSRTYPPDFEIRDAAGELIAAVEPSNPTMIDIYRLSDEQIDSMLELIDSTTLAVSEQSDLYDIIIEECSAFFAGAKDAKQTADIIQSRASLYIAEHS